MTPTLDLTSFIMNGFSTVSLDMNLLLESKYQADRETWATDTNDGTYEALWCTNNGTTTMDNLPTPYRSLVNQVVEVTRASIGNHACVDTISLWKGAEFLDWHDHIDDGEIEGLHWLIYLGDRVWHPAAGGLLLIKNDQQPEKIFTFAPVFGTAVVLNNTKHHFLHAVTAYQPLSTRIVLQVGFSTSRPASPPAFMEDTKA